MPIAAVPAYLLRDDADVGSPALRFGLLLPIWTTRQDQEKEVRERAAKKSREAQEVSALLERQGMDATIAALQRRERNPLPGLWDKNDLVARQAFAKVARFTDADRCCMKALAGRQKWLRVAVGEAILFYREAISIAPFATGLGNEHPLENGFAFLNPYGLPYLAGSGVKGVLRQAARELASGQWGEQFGWSEEGRYELQVGKERVRLSMLDALFGLESKDGDATHVRGALSFWDVIPKIEGDSLHVEIMTPHQTHYYQQDNSKDAGSISPHDSGQPTPICFLTVPPGSTFIFHVVGDLAHLRRIAPDLVDNGRWKTLLEAAFDHAFDWLGFGAKTAVGYGAMMQDPDVGDRAIAATAGSQTVATSQPDRASQVVVTSVEPTIEHWPQAQLGWIKGKSELTASCEGKKAFSLSGEGPKLIAHLSEPTQKRLSNGKAVPARVTVKAEGRNWVITSAEEPPA